MHVVKPYQSAITMFGRDGSVRVFKSMKAARKALGIPWIVKNVGKNFREFSCTSNLGLKVFERKPIYIEYAYIMRDDSGDPVTAKEILDAEIERRRRWRRFEYCGEGPVPGLFGWRRGYFGRYFRRPKTMQERRLAQASGDPFEPKPRGARNVRNLPHANDDLKRSDINTKNWKASRKTRYHRLPDHS